MSKLDVLLEELQKEKAFVEIGKRGSISMDAYANQLFQFCLNDYLTQFGNNFDLAIGPASKDAAIGLGHHAKRTGLSKQDMQKWLQKNYGAVFVRCARLKPPFGLKEISKFMFHGYDTWSRRK